MKLTKNKLRQFIREEVQNVLKEETATEFADDSDKHDPRVRNPETGEEWVRYDPMRPLKYLDPDSLSPEDRADYFQDQYDDAVEEFGENHPSLRQYKKNRDDARTMAHNYAQKYNIEDSDFYNEVIVNPSIKPHDTKSFFEPYEIDLIKKFEEKWDGEDPFEWFAMYHMNAMNALENEMGLAVAPDNLEKLRRAYEAAKHLLPQFSFEALARFEERMIYWAKANNMNDAFLKGIYRDLDKIYSDKGAKYPKLYRAKPKTHSIVIGKDGMYYYKNLKTGKLRPMTQKVK